MALKNNNCERFGTFDFAQWNCEGAAFNLVTFLNLAIFEIVKKRRAIAKFSTQQIKICEHTGVNSLNISVMYGLSNAELSGKGVNFHYRYCVATKRHFAIECIKST